MSRHLTSTDAFLLSEKDLAELLVVIRQRGYQLIGPTVRDSAVVFDEIECIDDLPVGVEVTQEPGSYRMTKTGNPTRFDYACGPTSLKRFLYPPRIQFWKAHRSETGFSFSENHDPSPKYAFIGARPCDLKAVEIQDKVFIGSQYTDKDYKERRENALFVAVNCLHPGATCFCASMGSGPSAHSGYDILLTEQQGEDSVYYLAEFGSETGKEILDTLALTVSTTKERKRAVSDLKAAEKRITQQLDTAEVSHALKQSLESPRWDDIAERCLACTNCTLVCPTCFCSSVEDHTNLAGDVAERSRVWDSCFQQSFSYVAGGSIRTTIKGRYRQWLTHKLSNWKDQFDTLGCVGCGRCITWCPVGIDIVKEANAFSSELNSKQSLTKGASL